MDKSSKSDQLAVGRALECVVNCLYAAISKAMLSIAFPVKPLVI